MPPTPSLADLSVLMSSGRQDEAARLLENLCRTSPSADAWCLLGAVRGQQGRFEECLAALEAAVALDVNHADAHYNRAQAYMHLGRPREAIAAYREVVRLRPDHAVAWNNLGYPLAQIGAFAEAVDCHWRALAIRPNDPEILNNLGNALAGAGQTDEAIASYRAAIQARPAYAEAHANLTNVFRRAGRLEEALTACDDALQALPGVAKLHVVRGLVLQQRGQTAEAHRDFARAVELDPRSESARSALLFNLNYFEGDPARLFQAHASWDEAIGTVLRSQTPFTCERRPARRLRVGYVSPNLCLHSVAFFLEPLLAAHDRGVIESWCYADVAKGDEVTRRLRSLSDHWRDIAGWTPDAVARAIRADAIDILVDLAGHTASNLPLVFARKPAPVQVAWLGYPNTAGMRAMDYRLTDARADPPGESDQYHVESLVRLPGGFLCYRPPDESPEIANSPHPGVTFGSFNKLAKVGDEVIAAWARILHSVPDSRLIIKNRGLGDAAAVRRYRERFARSGVAGDRLELRTWVPSKSGHLGQYADVDVGLDTFPYNGTTTTCEALWMGMPVVCLAGNRHAARVGVSLLSQLGLSDLIAADVDAYVQLAAALAADPARRAELRASLRARMRSSPLCDAQRFAREVEAAYRAMWEKWCADA